VEGLPLHTWIKVAFDLYLIRSWNGNVINWGPGGNMPGEEGAAPDYIVGPDLWNFQFENIGLVRSSFANYPGFPQSYPEAYPGGDHPTGSGSVEEDALGYTFAGIPMDSVYHFEFVIPHSDPTLDLFFSALGLQEVENESWGLDNVQVKYNLNLVFSVFLPIISR
jgi:hypothetical protein